MKQSDVDVHAKDRYAVTPLAEAVRKHRDDVIVLLVDHGASWLMDGIGELLCSYVGRCTRHVSLTKIMINETFFAIYMLM